MPAVRGAARRPAFVAAVVPVFVAVFAACAAPTPPRMAGGALCAQLEGLTLDRREARLWQQFEAADFPELLRSFVPVTTSATIGGRLRTATFWVARDYFGFGGDDDWCRMPMTPQLAQAIADRLGCVLPTSRMVDAIWAAADERLEPLPFHPRSHDILAVALFLRHHERIEAELLDAPATALVAGHKKDIVVSALLADWPDRVVIYGWHHLDGVPIQPRSKVHTFGHVDYSHGARLVRRAMQVDGEATTVDAVLADAQLHVLLSDEGPFASWRYPTAPFAAPQGAGNFP